MPCFSKLTPRLVVAFSFSFAVFGDKINSCIPTFNPLISSFLVFKLFSEVDFSDFFAQGSDIFLFKLCSKNDCFKFLRIFLRSSFDNSSIISIFSSVPFFAVVQPLERFVLLVYCFVFQNQRLVNR